MTDSVVTPSRFSEIWLGKKDILNEDGSVKEHRRPYGWQAEAMDPFVDICKKRVKVTVASPNGTGRSSYCQSDTALWNVAVHPLGRSVLTTTDSKQMDNQIWPSILCHKTKFPHWTWRDREITTDTGGQLICFVTDDPGRAEGWHKLPGATDETGPLFMGIDEAKSFDPAKFVAVDRCTYNGLMYSSSTGLMEGRFFESHHSLDGFIRIKAGLKQCPHIKQDRIDDIIRTYGEDSPVTKSILYAEFMNFDGVSKFVFQLEALANARISKPPEIGTDTVAFFDFAAGGAENVIAVRRGNRVTLEACWRDANTMSGSYRFMAEAKRLKLRANQCYGDNSGLGLTMITTMAEAGFQINRVNANARATAEGYENISAEMWHETAGMVRRGEIILPLEDAELYKQLSTRRVDWGPRGLGIESKEKMAKRGAESPDRGDAVCGAAFHKDVMGRLTEVERVNKRISDYADSQKEENQSSYSHLQGML